MKMTSRNFQTYTKKPENRSSRALGVQSRLRRRKHRPPRPSLAGLRRRNARRPAARRVSENYLYINMIIILDKRKGKTNR